VREHSRRVGEVRSDMWGAVEETLEPGGGSSGREVITRRWGLYNSDNREVGAV